MAAAWLLFLALVPIASAQCDPLVPEVCAYPFPNDYWRINGKLSFTDDTLPADNTGQRVNIGQGGWAELDGFSPIPGIMTYFPDLSLDGFPRLWDINFSLSPASATVLLDTSTGELLPHWAELDHSSDNEFLLGYKRTLIIWPAARLKDSTRYIVAIRNAKTTFNRPIQPSPAFRALRENIATEDPAIESRRTHYNLSVFPVLEAVQVPRKSLLLAWDFTTMSTHTITNRFLSMREDAWARTADGIDYEIVSSEDNPSNAIARRIRGFMKVPWYLTQLEPGTAVRVNTAAGDPNTALYNGDHEVEFTVLIPRSLVDNRSAGLVLQYGHGLFGSQKEIDAGYLDDEANTNGFVLIASTWAGLSNDDVPSLAIMLASDLSNFPMVPDRLHQGMLNALLLMRLVTSPSFVKDPHVVFNGVSTIDPTRRMYYGNSLGGIMGTVYTAVSPDVSRGVIGVGGGPFELLLPRSSDFSILFDVLKLRYTDPLVRPILLSFLELLWNRMEPAGWVSHIVSPLPGCPPKTVVFHYGAGDAQVTWLGAQTLARSVGAVMFSSNIRVANETLFGFDFVSDSTVVTDRNVIQGWDFGALVPPLINIPASKKTDSHAVTRRAPTAQAQTARFFLEGQIYNACGGPCKKQL